MLYADGFTQLASKKWRRISKTQQKKEDQDEENWITQTKRAPSCLLKTCRLNVALLHSIFIATVCHICVWLLLSFNGSIKCLPIRYYSCVRFLRHKHALYCCFLMLLCSTVRINEEKLGKINSKFNCLKWKKSLFRHVIICMKKAGQNLNDSAASVWSRLASKSE